MEWFSKFRSKITGRVVIITLSLLLYAGAFGLSYWANNLEAYEWQITASILAVVGVAGLYYIIETRES